MKQCNVRIETIKGPFELTLSMVDDKTLSLEIDEERVGNRIMIRMDYPGKKWDRLFLNGKEIEADHNRIIELKLRDPLKQTLWVINLFPRGV